MDIQYLLFLQDFRNSIDNALTPFMEGVSMFAVTYLILFPVYYYWNRNKKDGLYALVAYYFCMVITPLVKLTACVYRPWIRDSRIVPAGKAIVTATGYSFPSGHTTTAAPLAGGMVVNTWKEPRLRVASVLFAAFIALTMFSRNYLGVHTPQDVCVGLGVSVLSLFFTAKLVSDIPPAILPDRPFSLPSCNITRTISTTLIIASKIVNIVITTLILLYPPDQAP